MDRIPVGGGGGIFCTRLDGTEAQKAFYTTGIDLFPGLKWPGFGVDYTPHLVPRLKEEYNYTYTPSLSLYGRLKGLN
jgi:hypothetical protein